MPERTPLQPSAPAEHVFPTLTPAQIERFAAHGRLRRVAAGEILAQAGTPARVYVVRTGEIEAVQPDKDERLVALFRPGDHGGTLLRALTIRVGLSVAFFLLLLLGWWLGILEPHGLRP